MSSHRQSPTRAPHELSEVKARTFVGRMRVDLILDHTDAVRVRETADPHHVIRLLSLITRDEQVNSQSPARVVEALQNHGHLLCDDAVDVLRDWLEETLRS